MSAYLFMQIVIVDEVRWAEYRTAVVPLIERFGGRHVTQGGGARLLEGEDDGRRIAVFEFSAMEALDAFWRSPEYVPVRWLREGAAALQVWAVPG